MYTRHLTVVIVVRGLACVYTPLDRCTVQLPPTILSIFVSLSQVFFLPMSNTILSCFKDDSIHAWEADSLEYKYQIPPPFGPAPHYRAFAASRDGSLLVAGGRSSFIHLWKMENRQLLRIVQLPSKVRLVKQLVFLTNNFDGGSSEVCTLYCSRV